MSAPDLATSLAEVRRAFRVAVAYQRRVNELYESLNLALGGVGLEFERWYPNHYQPPMASSKRQFDPGKWAWDLFPGYCLAAEWLGATPAPRRVWVGLDTDTAFARAKARGQGAQPDPSALEPVDSEHSQSELWVGLYRADRAVDWSALWKSQLAASWRQAIDAELPWSFAGATGTYECFCVPLDQLVDEAAVDRLLVGRVRAWGERTKAPGVS